VGEDAHTQGTAIVMAVRLSDGGVAARISHAKQVSSVVFSSQERYLLTSGYDRVTLLTELNTGHLPQRLSGDYVVKAAAFSADERYVATGSYAGTLVFCAFQLMPWMLFGCLSSRTCRCRLTLAG
jgi:WD40 repeat protein